MIVVNSDRTDAEGYFPTSTKPQDEGSARRATVVTAFVKGVLWAFVQYGCCSNATQQCQEHQNSVYHSCHVLVLSRLEFQTAR